MSIDLSGGADGVIGYKSKKNSHVVDLTMKGHYNVNDFWEPVTRNASGTLILEPEEFYILSSKSASACPASMRLRWSPTRPGAANSEPTTRAF